MSFPSRAENPIYFVKDLLQKKNFLWLTTAKSHKKYVFHTKTPYLPFPPVKHTGNLFFPSPTLLPLYLPPLPLPPASLSFPSFFSCTQIKMLTPILKKEKGICFKCIHVWNVNVFYWLLIRELHSPLLNVCAYVFKDKHLNIFKCLLRSQKQLLLKYWLKIL